MVRRRAGSFALHRNCHYSCIITSKRQQEYESAAAQAGFHAFFIIIKATGTVTRNAVYKSNMNRSLRHRKAVNSTNTWSIVHTITGIDHKGTRRQVPALRIWSGGIVPHILSCCKILSRLLALQCRKMCFLPLQQDL